MRRRLRIGLAHEDEDLAAWIACARRPPLARIDDVVVTVSAYRALNVRRIRGRHVGFGHGKSGAHLAVEQRFEPARLLLFGPVAREHFHVAGVGCRAVEHFGPDGRSTHDLREGRIVEIAQSCAEFGIRKKQIPQTRFARPRLHLLHDGGQLPARRAALQLRIVERLVGVDVLVHEGFEPSLKALLLVGKREIHQHRSLSHLLPCRRRVVNRRVR